ncbi:MAG TPA: divergent PAP2 family protein [Candidatus Cloacimonetes bacterium]|nr:divergent PAP2 family protein [Candidatus Cloacimonadota bacterium]
MGEGFILGNRILDIVVVSLVVSQTIKVIFYIFKEKKLNFRKYLDTGSMPSSHSASVSSLATAVGISEGVESVFFAISIIFAVVVMYDATGVRRAVGKQAIVLNKMIDNIRKKENAILFEENLKELIGHTPLEVLAGALLGVAIAFVMS